MEIYFNLLTFKDQYGKLNFMNPIPLNAKEYKGIWDWVYNELSFSPSVHAGDWASIKTKMPFHKFSIDFLWRGPYDQKRHAGFMKKAIDTFITITHKGDTIYAFDWQHEGFHYDPRELRVDGLLDSESSINVISFIPDGDYYIFITKNLQNNWFGHPWERSITLIGETLISAAAEHGLPIT